MKSDSRSFRIFPAASGGQASPVRNPFGAVLSAAFVLLSCVLLTSSVAFATPSQTQQFPLSAGWNLISIQVGNGTTPEQFKNSLGLADASKLRAIWGFGRSSIAGSAPWQWKFYRADAGHPNDLLSLQPGKGYWVDVSAHCTATLTGVPWDGSISLQAGWNLVGFPGLVREDAEQQELASVFGETFDRISQVWGWDASGAQRFVGYDIAAIPQVKELTGVLPGRGYWVYALDAITLLPVPSLALVGDADASPLEDESNFSAADPRWHGSNPALYVGTQIRWSDAEDASFDLNANGLLDSAFTQDTLLFDVGVDRKVISVANRGTGAFNWSIENTIAWLFTEATDEKNHPGNAGRAKNAAGTVSSESDAVTLFADTRGLLPGRHTANFLAHLGDSTRVITVKLEVPTSAGDWKGYASTQRVNGKSIGIGAVDMGLNIFMLSDSPSESRFRAVLNKDTSLLFPRDVFMNGVFYSGNQFSLTTNFELAPADRNAPPFDTFPVKRAANAPAPALPSNPTALARTDSDVNGNGKVDVDNPFPFPVHREITLLGGRTTPNRMEGSYIESITGMLPANQPIFIEGTFFLDRQTYQPTKRSIFNQSTTGAPILIGGTSGQLFRETTISVANAVSIQGVTVSLNVSFPTATLLTITLTGPNNQVITLHRNASSIPGSIDLSDFNGIIGQGTWKLRVAWNATPERGYFNGWGLNIQGLATYNVSGKVIGDLDNNAATPHVPLTGAHLVLSGSNLIEQTDTVADGTFTIGNLTENNYTLTITRPGFETRAITFFLNNANLFIHHGSPKEIEEKGGGASASPSVLASDPVVLTPFDVTAPQLRLGPALGPEPLYVNFSALVPLADLNAIGAITSASWHFGDGTAAVLDTASLEDSIAQTTAKHLYEKAGDYSATLVLTGATGSRTLTSQNIHVQRIMPDARTDAPSTQLIAAGFVGSFAAPLSNANVTELSAAGTVNQTVRVRQPNGSYSDVALTNIPSATVPQESKRDTGGFDIDRPPLIQNSNGSDFHFTTGDLEDSDFTAQLYVSGDGTLTLPFLFRVFNPDDDPPGDNTPGTFSTYVPPEYAGTPTPERFRIFTTLGGSVFNPQAARVGDLILQSGRVEP